MAVTMVLTCLGFTWLGLTLSVSVFAFKDLISFCWAYLRILLIYLILWRKGVSKWICHTFSIKANFICLIKKFKESSSSFFEVISPLFLYFFFGGGLMLVFSLYLLFSWHIERGTTEILNLPQYLLIAKQYFKILSVNVRKTRFLETNVKTAGMIGQCIVSSNGQH